MAFTGQLGAVASQLANIELGLGSGVGVQFDAASNSGYQSATSSLSWAHTWSGTNRMLAIDVEILSVNDTVTALTYGGATCTLIGTRNVIGGTGRVESWRICQNDSGAPAAGSNTISVTLSGSVACAGTAVSYTTVNQTTPTEAFAGNSGINAGTGTNATVSVTTLTNNDWVHAALATNQASGVASSQTSRNVVAGTLGTGANSDTGPLTPAGSQTMTFTGEGITAAWAICGYGILPAAPPAYIPYDLQHSAASDHHGDVKGEKMLAINEPQRFVKTNGVVIVFGEHNTFGVGVPDQRTPRVLLLEVDYRGKPYKSDYFEAMAGYRDAVAVDLSECMVRVKEGDVVLAELGTEPHGALHQPYMVWPGEQEYETDNGVTIPPALRIVDETGALWTLGFETAPKELSPDGEFAFNVLRDGVAIPGAVASRIEYRNGQVRIFTNKGWRRWLGRSFS